MKRLIVNILSIVVCLMMSHSASFAQKIAFAIGEELSYTASYEAKLLSTDVADIVFRTTGQNCKGQPAYCVEAHASTRSFFSFFFKMDDLYRTWISKTDMRPLYSDVNIREGGYRFKYYIDYDWNAKMANGQGRNLKRDPYKISLPLRERSYDPIATFFNLRNLDLASKSKGFVDKIDVLLTDTIVTVRYKLVGRELIEIAAIGTVRCQKIQCELATIDGESFPEGSDFYIWISDDDNHIPIYLETPIRIGKVQAVLSSYKGLAHPFTSLVKKANQ